MTADANNEVIINLNIRLNNYIEIYFNYRILKIWKKWIFFLL
jgi:hypothetical protein